jgi:hypothetical protein
MLELIFGFIFELLFEAVIEILSELAIDFGLVSIKHSLRKEKKANPVFAYTGIVLIGALVGVAASFILPGRIVTNPPIKGLSLILSPLLAGIMMYVFGNWRRENGHETSRLSTFWGGALFAFSFALVRWFMIGGA